MGDDSQINLAREPDFRLGALAVSPATREVRRGELRESLEPRVMQVLVALNAVGGQVLSRDELIEKCWEGRVVGEDAINRAIGRLRRLAEADNGASFTIETIPRVGYRLLAEGAAPVAGAAAPSRRLMLAGAGAAALVAGGFAWWRLAAPAPALPPDIAAMVAAGLAGLHDHTPEGLSRAVGIFERVVAAVPSYADGWGALAVSCAYQSHMASTSREGLLIRARAAIAKTESLDPTNAYIFAAKAWLLPNLGTWRERDRLNEAGLKLHPDNPLLLGNTGLLRAHEGRYREAADLITRSTRLSNPPGADITWLNIMTLWAAGRVQEADAAAQTGIALYPRQIYVWVWRFYSYLYTGRSDEALAMIANVDGRPPGVDADQLDGMATAATALKSRSKSDIARATALQLDAAHKGSGLALNAMVSTAAMGEIDTAFAIAEAVYFGRGFDVAQIRFSAQQGVFSEPQDRHTYPLFWPNMTAMQQDKRFRPLVEELGLVKYWRDSGTKPDSAALFL